MSLSSPAAAEPRRGGRARKQVQKYGAGGGKGKQRQEDEDEVSDDEGAEGESEASEGSDREATPRPLQANNRVANGAKRKSTGGAGRANKKAQKKAAPAPDGEVQENGETANPEGLKDDSKFFNAMITADPELSEMIEKWIEDYQEASDDETSERAAIHQLVMFFIRCCGLGSTIEVDEAIDQDGIGDVLETIQDESIRSAPAIYPLISKAKSLRSFKTNLNNFIFTFIQNLALTPILFETVDSTSYTAPLIDVLLVWLHTMSSSPLRPIRHTSTYMVLKINSALCEVAAEVNKELSLRQRQREHEEKKDGQTNASKKKLKEAENKVKEVHERKTRLEALMSEIFDVLFVHRVRDADPSIRTDCLRELGVWVKKYPEEYISTSYLTYFTRGCNDPNASARLETAKALAALYTKDTHFNNIRTITSRLVPRLVEMALKDIDLSVRTHALSVITALDKTGVLQDDHDEQRQLVARLVFDNEARIRKAVGGFFRGLWEERTEQLKTEWSSSRGQKKKRASGIVQGDMDRHLSWKALAGLLVEQSQILDDASATAGPSRESSLSAGGLERAAAAVESLWGDFEELRDWEGLVDYLLLDHSTADEDAWLLNEDEENFMLQLLIACIKKEDKDVDADERSKTLMKILPRLFTKHQADVARMAGILAIPQQMNLGLYLDMRKNAAYDSLWDDVTKQFLQHSDETVLIAAMKAVNHLCANNTMATSNASKLAALEEALFGSLRDALDGEDVPTLSMDEDRIATMETIMLRIALLSRSRDTVEVMEDAEGGQSTAWDITCAFAERGGVGYKEESKMVENALQVVFLHISWLFRRFAPEDAHDVDKVSALKEKRDRALDIFRRLGLRETNSSAATEAVSRNAFTYFINLSILFSAKAPTAHPAAKAAPLKVVDEIQHRLGGSFQAAVERHASDRENAAQEDESAPLTAVQGEFPFLQVTSAFVGAIRCGVLDVDHAKEPLAHFGRFDSTYDAVVRKLVDVLRDEGIYNRESDTVQHVAGTALQESFSIFLESLDTEPNATVALAKLLATAFVIHGNHFTVLRQIHPNDIFDLHMSLLGYLGKRLQGFISSERNTKNKDAKARFAGKRAQALTFFRPLILLLGPVTAQDAVKLHDRVKELEEDIGLEVGLNKSWDAWKAYDKKLLNIASKDPKYKAMLEQQDKAAKAKSTNGHTEGENGNEVAEDEGTEQDEDEVREEEEIQTSTGKRRRETDSPAPENENENGDDEVVEPLEDGPGDITNEEIDLHFDSMDNVDFDMDLDLGSQVSLARERSLSVEPAAKKPRTRRF